MAEHPAARPSPERLHLERLADIEGAERRANEHLRTVARADGEDAILRVRCECGDDGCHEPLSVTHSTYERVRADSMLFLVLPGHVMQDAEDIVEAGDGWDIVKKHEIMRDVVERSDPRR